MVRLKKMTLCLNHYKAKESAANDNDPIGIILATDGNPVSMGSKPRWKH